MSETSGSFEFSFRCTSDVLFATILAGNSELDWSFLFVRGVDTSTTRLIPLKISVRRASVRPSDTQYPAFIQVRGDQTEQVIRYMITDQ